MQYVLIDLHQPDMHVPLTNNRYTVGSGDEDTIYLANAKEKQLSMTFSDGYLTLLSAQAPIWVEGELVTKFPIDVYPMDVVSLSEDVHFTFMLPTEAAPEAPNLKKPHSDAKWDVAQMVGILKGNLRQILLLGAFTMVIASVAVGAKWFSEPSNAPTEVVPSASMALPQEALEKFAKESLGKAFFSSEVDGDTFIILAIAEEADNFESRYFESRYNDIQAVANRLATPLKVRIIVINLQEVTQRINHRLQQDSASKYLKATRDGRQVKITGVVMPSMQERADAIVAGIDEKAVQIVRDYTVDQRFTVKVVSVSVGEKGAYATVRQNGKYAMVAEGGAVFNLGTLKLVRTSGIIVATNLGDVEIGL